MDPFTAIGTAASITGIIEVICKTVKSLRELHERWKDADLTILNLISQLSALKAALNKIGEWISEDFADIPQHHQLVIDLEDSITCCRMLMKSMDTQIEKLDFNPNNSLNFGSKIRVVLEDKARKDFQQFIERQISVLYLLLTACNCKTSSEQKKLLEKPSSRLVFDQIKDDSSSLFALCDTSSLFSRTYTTDNSSKKSRIFVFDDELKYSKAYQYAAWSNYKKGFQRRKQPDGESVKSGLTALGQASHVAKTTWEAIARPRNDDKMEDTLRSREIDSSLEQDRRSTSRECPILLFGDGGRHGNNPSHELLKTLKMVAPADDDFMVDREQIRSIVLEGVQSYARCCLEFSSKRDGSINTTATTVLALSKSPGSVTPELATEFGVLWKSSVKSELAEVSLEIDNSTFYFLNNIDRIAQTDYIPTKPDIVQGNLKPRSPGAVVETRLSMGSLNFHAFMINFSRSGPKWFHLFENTTAIIFSVDLCWYDVAEAYLEDFRKSKKTRLQNYLDYFESVVNSRWFPRSSIILLLTNFSDFRDRLCGSPLKKYFADYSGGIDAIKAADHILGRFAELNRAHLDLYHHMTDPYGYGDAKFIFDTIKEIIITINVRCHLEGK